MEIRIVNLRNYKKQENEVLIKVDRSSILGNPFHMQSEIQREEVCDKYKRYFEKKIEIRDEKFIDKLCDIRRTLLYKNVALGCWCFPLRCHAETIMNFIKHRFI